METLKTKCGLRWLWVVGLLAGGCGDPPYVVDNVPPGGDVRLSMMDKIKEEPEALGEQAPGRNKSAANLPILSVASALPTAIGEQKTTESGVTYETTREGTGAVVKAGQVIIVHYTGTFDDGRVFDSSKGKTPMTTPIGTGKVIKGWDEAIPGMKVGEIRKLTIPPSAGYGALGVKGSIPANATLHFEVELINTQ